jgi:hypothetical protein
MIEGARGQKFRGNEFIVVVAEDPATFSEKLNGFGLQGWKATGVGGSYVTTGSDAGLHLFAVLTRKLWSECGVMRDLPDLPFTPRPTVEQLFGQPSSPSGDAA